MGEQSGKQPVITAICVANSTYNNTHRQIINSSVNPNMKGLRTIMYENYLSLIVEALTCFCNVVCSKLCSARLLMVWFLLSTVWYRTWALGQLSCCRRRGSSCSGRGPSGAMASGSQGASRRDVSFWVFSSWKRFPPYANSSNGVAKSVLS